jgi:hypothetical protein
VRLEDRTPDTISFRVRIAPDAPWGTSYDLIYVAFNNREHPSLNVRVKARKGHPLAVIPATLKLSTFAGEPQLRKVRLMSSSVGAGAFRITNVECPDGITVGDVSPEPASAFNVGLTFHPPSDSQAFQSLGEQKIIFHTDPPGAATLVVRYAAPVDGKQGEWQ